jgi:hypothetical protein
VVAPVAAERDDVADLELFVVDSHAALATVLDLGHLLGEVA